MLYMLRLNQYGPSVRCTKTFVSDDITKGKLVTNIQSIICVKKNIYIYSYKT